MEPQVEVSAFASAVAELFNARFDSLYRYIDRLSGDADLAMDVAQEAFVRLYRRGEMPDDPHAWITTVANNILRDDRRLVKRRGELLTTHVAALSPMTDQAGPDESLISAEAQARVRAALTALPLRDRQLLLLRHEGYSYRELAVAVGVAEGSVGTMLVRAMRAFRQTLQRTAPLKRLTSIQEPDHASD
jgi:RNA polymerase sigma-70 factor (ECF subfamily)